MEIKTANRKDDRCCEDMFNASSFDNRSSSYSSKLVFEESKGGLTSGAGTKNEESDEITVSADQPINLQIPPQTTSKPEMNSSAKSSKHTDRKHFETSPYQDSDCNFASSKNSMSPQHNIHTVIEGTKRLSILVFNKGDFQQNNDFANDNEKNYIASRNDDDESIIKLRLQKPRCTIDQRLLQERPQNQENIPNNDSHDNTEDDCGEEDQTPRTPRTDIQYNYTGTDCVRTDQKEEDCSKSPKIEITVFNSATAAAEDGGDGDGDDQGQHQVTNYGNERQHSGCSQQDDQRQLQQRQSYSEGLETDEYSEELRMLSVIRETDEPEDDTYKNLQKNSTSSQQFFKDSSQMTPKEQFSIVMTKSNEGCSLLCPNDMIMAEPLQQNHSQNSQKEANSQFVMNGAVKSQCSLQSSNHEKDNRKSANNNNNSSNQSCVLDDSLTVSEQNSQVNNPADLMTNNMATQPKLMQNCLKTSSSSFTMKLSELIKKQMPTVDYENLNREETHSQQQNDPSQVVANYFKKFQNMLSAPAKTGGKSQQTRSTYVYSPSKESFAIPIQKLIQYGQQISISTQESQSNLKTTATQTTTLSPKQFQMMESARTLQTTEDVNEKTSSPQRTDQQLKGINEGMQNLKQDIMRLLKETKIQKQRMVGVSNNKNSLEERLDDEFLENMMQRYAFFTSSLNLSLQSDTETTKLTILLPMIEKYASELKREEQAMLMHGDNIVIFDQQTSISTIEQRPSDNTSVTSSMNNTILNQLNNRSSQLRRDNQTNIGSIGGLQTVQKLSHLQTQYYMAMQVLQLTKLKLNLIQMNTNKDTLIQQKPATTSKKNNSGLQKNDSRADNNHCQSTRQLNLSPYSNEPAFQQTKIMKLQTLEDQSQPPQLASPASTDLILNKQKQKQIQQSLTQRHKKVNREKLSPQSKDKQNVQAANAVSTKQPNFNVVAPQRKNLSQGSRDFVINSTNINQNHSSYLGGTTYAAVNGNSNNMVLAAKYQAAYNCVSMIVSTKDRTTSKDNEGSYESFQETIADASYMMNCSSTTKSVIPVTQSAANKQLTSKNHSAGRQQRQTKKQRTAECPKESADQRLLVIGSSQSASAWPNGTALLTATSALAASSSLKHFVSPVRQPEESEVSHAGKKAIEDLLHARRIKVLDVDERSKMSGSDYQQSLSQTSHTKIQQQAQNNNNILVTGNDEDGSIHHQTSQQAKQPAKRLRQMTKTMTEIELQQFTEELQQRAKQAGAKPPTRKLKLAATANPEESVENSKKNLSRKNSSTMNLQQPTSSQQAVTAVAATTTFLQKQQEVLRHQQQLQALNRSGSVGGLLQAWPGGSSAASATTTRPLLSGNGKASLTATGKKGSASAASLLQAFSNINKVINNRQQRMNNSNSNHQSTPSNNEQASI